MSASIQSLKLQNFRALSSESFDFGSSRFVLIKGENGSGKSSILEALVIATGLRSFRTPHIREVIQDGQEVVSIGVTLSAYEEVHHIHIGADQKSRKVRLDKRLLTSAKSLHELVRPVAMTEDDINLVKGSPSVRREYLAQVACMKETLRREKYKQMRRVLDQRNRLLFQLKQQGVTNVSYVREQLFSWTKQLWEMTQEHQGYFKVLAKQLEEQVNEQLKIFFSREPLKIVLEYQPERDCTQDISFEDFWESLSDQSLLSEVYIGRSRFGVHLDDLEISLKNRSARTFASRGQQKLVALLLRIAQVKLLDSQQTILMLDDFVTDFDEKRIVEALNAVKALECQTFVTLPLSEELNRLFEWFDCTIKL